MTMNYDMNHGDVLITPVMDALQEFIGAAAPSFSMHLLNATTIEVTAGTGDDQQTVAIDGRWRWRTTSRTKAHPAGAAGTYDVYVTASDNDFTLGGTTVDNTVYDFDLDIKLPGFTPSTALHRKVGETDWNGSAITSLRTLAGSRMDDAPIVPTANIATETPLRVRGTSGQSAALAVFEDSLGVAQGTLGASGALTILGALTAPSAVLSSNGGKTTLALTNTTANVGLTIGADTNLYRSAADTLATDDALTVTGVLTLNASATTLAAGNVLTWGADTNLYRNAANVLKTDDALTVAGTLTGMGAVSLASASTVTWNADTNLYRSGVGALRTDGSFQSAALTATAATLTSNGGKTTLALTNTTADVGLTIGGDTNLYRSAADTLKTDDAFVTASTLTATSATLSSTLTATGATLNANGGKTTLALTNTTANVGLTIGGDTTLYRSAASTLKTDAAFVAGGTLAATIATFSGALTATTATLNTNGGKTTLALTNTTANVGITIGGDTNLYRSGPDTLATDDALVVGGQAVVVTNDARLTNTRTPTASTITPAMLAGGPTITSGHGITWNGTAWIDANLVLDSDSRLTNTRTPTAGTITPAMLAVASKITGYSAFTGASTRRTLGAGYTMDQLRDVVDTLRADLTAWNLIG